MPLTYKWLSLVKTQTLIFWHDTHRKRNCISNFPLLLPKAPMATSLPMQASRHHLPHAPGPLHTFDFFPIFVVINLNWDLRVLCDPDWPRHCCNFSLIGNFFKWRRLNCASTLCLCRECTAHSQNLLKFSAPLACAFTSLQATKLELVFGILTLPPTFF